MLKILKRYSVVGALIILCFFSAFIALCNGLLSTVQASNIIQKENQYAYNNEVLVTIRTSKPITAKQLFQITDTVTTCNVYLENMEIYFDQIDGVYRPDVLLCQNEKLSIPTYNDITSLPHGTIIAASSNVLGNDNLSVHGKSVSIFDTMDSDEFPFISGLFIINATDYFEIFPAGLEKAQEVSLKIASRVDDVYSAYSKIKSNLADVIPDAQIYHSEVITTDSVFQNILSQESLISMGLFLFALINTMIISYYWVIVRRREIAIRKAFGATNFSVIVLMASELLKLIGLSAVLALGIQILLWVTQGNSLDIQDALFMAVILILSITIAVILSMIVPVRYILQIQPSEGVKL